MSWWVYILRCADGSLYSGITTDLQRRLAEHNSASSTTKYTRMRQPVEMVYSRAHPDRSAASQEEYRLKKLPRDAKLDLISRQKML